jgi:hypothetical protein
VRFEIFTFNLVLTLLLTFSSLELVANTSCRFVTLGTLVFLDGLRLLGSLQVCG